MCIVYINLKVGLGETDSKICTFVKLVWLQSLVINTQIDR